MNDCYIYVIKNMINGKVYIGSTDRDMKKRYDHEHRYRLNERIHNNSHLQRAWNKYGEDNFKVIILEKCSENNLLDIEQEYVDFLFENYDNSQFYNIARDTKAPMKGRNHSDESIKLMEQEQRNRDDYLSGEDHGMYGRTHTKEVRDILSEVHSNKEITEEHKKACREKMRGDNHTSSKVSIFEAKLIKFMTQNKLMSQVTLADKFGISQMTVSDIKCERTWKHLPDYSM